jgi:hypothetical protein
LNRWRRPNVSWPRPVRLRSCEPAEAGAEIFPAEGIKRLAYLPVMCSICTALLGRIDE